MLLRKNDIDMMILIVKIMIIHSSIAIIEMLLKRVDIDINSKNNKG